MIKALHVSPDVFGAITKALIDHEAGGGKYLTSETPGADILWLETPLSMIDAGRIANSETPIAVIVIWNKRYFAEVIEE